MDAALFLKIGGFLNHLGLVLSIVLLLPLLILVFPKPMAGPGKFVSVQMDRMTGIVSGLAMFAAIFLVTIQLVTIISSYALGLSFTWLSELVIYAFATLFMLGSSVALRNTAHVRVDILRPRFGEDGRNWVELVGIYLFLFPIMIRILQTGEQGLARSWSLFEGSRESDGLPILYIFKTLVPVFAVLMIIQGLSEALKAALRITGKLPPAEETHPEGAGHGA